MVSAASREANTTLLSTAYSDKPTARAISVHLHIAAASDGTICRGANGRAARLQIAPTWSHVFFGKGLSSRVDSRTASTPASQPPGLTPDEVDELLSNFPDLSAETRHLVALALKGRLNEKMKGQL